jgi:hypothetical protein
VNATAALTRARTSRRRPEWPTRNPLARRRLRREADRALRAGVHPDAASPLLALRASELTSPRERRRLRRSLHGLIRELDGTTLPGASPVNRPGIRPYAHLIAALERRIGDDASPVSARGVLLVRELLTDPDGPLYDRHRAIELPDRIDDALDALDGR